MTPRDVRAPWPEIDEHIVNGRNVLALKLLRETFGLSIHQAVDVLDERYHRLRELRPGPADGEVRGPDRA